MSNRNSKESVFSTRTLTALGLLAALSVILARLAIRPSPDVKISFDSLPIILSGYLFGPVAGAAVGFVSDAVGGMLSGFGYDPLLAIPPILIGLCAGLLRRIVIRKMSIVNILLTFLPAIVLGTLLWQTYWLKTKYGLQTGFWAYLGIRALLYAFISAVNALVIDLLMKKNVFTALRLWPPRGFETRDDAAKEKRE